MAAILTSCNPSGKPADHFSEYNLEAPEKFDMPEILTEISGIAFNKGESDTVYAIQDEEGKVFRLPWNVKDERITKFSQKGDFEDLSIINDEVVVLKSNGSLYSFPLSGTALEETQAVSEYKNLLPKGEYEGMFGDEQSGMVYILCKDCDADDSRKSVTGYIINLNATETIQTFHIQVDQIKAIHGKLEKGFRPSALARNPVNNLWYIVSSVNKILVIADSQWNVQNVVPLPAAGFSQPEGIAFDKTGNLYISNEGDKQGPGNILKFKKTGV